VGRTEEVSTDHVHGRLVKSRFCSNQRGGVDARMAPGLHHLVQSPEHASLTANSSNTASMAISASFRSS